MKTKILLLTTILSLGTYTLRAQNVKGGMATGVSTQSVKITQAGEQFNTVLKGTNVTGYEIGLFGKFELLPFYVKPSMLYHHTQGDLNVTQTGMEGDSKSSFLINTLEIPVIGGMRLLGPVGIEAGPVYHYIAKLKNGDEVDGLQVRKGGLGYKAEVSADLGIIELNAHYQVVTHKSTDATTSYSSPNRLTFGLGVALGSNRNK